jgi:blue light- and temperature-responsive anti-repressor
VSTLSTIVYRSRAIAPPADLDLFYMLGQARQRNREMSLTGILLYDRGHFFQWLEGPDERLGQVWQSIKRDPRHADVQIVGDMQIPIRLFGAWHMQFAHRDQQHAALVDGFVVADTSILDELHTHPEKAANILAEFSTLGGGAYARI